MNHEIKARNSNGESGAALVLALLMMALLLALTMGMSMTAVSELGVSNTYSNQTQAFQAAEAGLYHSVNLVRNYTGTTSAASGFTDLLSERVKNGTFNAYYLSGNNPFTDSSQFTAGCVMINNDDAAGHALRSAILDGAGNQLAVPGVHYQVHLVDDEKSTSGANPRIPNFTPSIAWEDADAAKDTNNRVVVYSTGTYGGSSVTLEGWIGFVPYPAFVAQRDVIVDGNSQIQGAYGGVHSNENLTVAGSADIAQTATAVGTGTFTTSGTIGGFHDGGQDPLYIPKFVTEPTATSSPHVQDYIVRTADVILIDPGFANGATRDLSGTDPATVRLKKLADSLGIPAAQYTDFATSIDSNTSGNVDQSGAEAVGINRATNPITFTRVTTSLSTYGWNYSGNNWNIPSNSTGASGHTFYVVGLDNYNLADPGNSPKNGGNVDIQGNAGTSASPIQATILCTGSITVSGNPYLVANLQNLRTNELPPFVTINILLAAVEDLQINGDVGAGSGIIRFSGICYAGEQVYLSGNGEIQGQVLALNNPNVYGTGGSTASPVDRDDNEVTGSFLLNFDGGRSVGKIKLMSWRQIKQ
ncbi:MAG TPA: PilX N-terminal domain-containing pilus assembly protein [Blastocatellia bacterium]|nr:PilX N-terminal domain-containing pilus assembly protein [Blastocatellia bacterium]